MISLENPNDLTGTEVLATGSFGGTKAETERGTVEASVHSCDIIIISPGNGAEVIQSTFRSQRHMTCHNTCLWHVPPNFPFYSPLDFSLQFTYSITCRFGVPTHTLNSTGSDDTLPLIVSENYKACYGVPHGKVQHPWHPLWQRGEKFSRVSDTGVDSWNHTGMEGEIERKNACEPASEWEKKKQKCLWESYQVVERHN